MRETFIKVLSLLIGAEPQSDAQLEELYYRIENLEQLLFKTSADLEKVQEVMSVLVMTNPHIRLTGNDNQASAAFLSGSDDPDRILN